MFIATVVIGVILALMMVMSARMKLVRDARVLDEICLRCKVPERWLPWLAAAELAGGAGVIVGLAIAPLGIAASVCLIAYMVLAIGAHVRVRDGGVGPALIALIASAAYLVPRVGSA